MPKSTLYKGHSGKGKLKGKSKKEIVSKCRLTLDSGVCEQRRSALTDKYNLRESRRYDKQFVQVVPLWRVLR